jgi:hypothetical protein
MSNGEFREIGHSGGRVTFRIATDERGHRSYQVSWESSRPVYALPQGIVVDDIRLGGIGQPWNPPPVPNCYPVFIASDSEGKFGHQCPRCRGYWRTRGPAHVCPYCGIVAAGHEFLSEAQRRYAAQYCGRLNEALEEGDNGDHVIDMDAVADAVGKDGEKPPFYYAEQTQQNQYVCDACDQFNDILGKFGYCSSCGTRNDIQELEQKVLPAIRGRINAGGNYESCLREAASAFDSLVSQYVKQLVLHIPMRPGRRARFETTRFHDLEAVIEELKTAFDIDICQGLKESEVDFAKGMFHRRHVYEHNGGEADEKYIRDSGDTSVRPKQALRETQESVHQFVGLVAAMARNLHRGFHEIFPPEDGPIKLHQERKRIMEARNNVGRASAPLARPGLSGSST